MKKIYMDYGASTPVDPEVLKEMIPYFNEIYGNPSSIHEAGRCAFDEIENARGQVAKSINAKPEEIIFTSGGTESDNLGIKGVAFLNKEKRKSKGNHIITCGIEHPAVLETCNYMKEIGFNVEFLPVDKQGLVDPADLEAAISDNTFLVSIMYANNEIGTIMPMKELGKITKENDMLFHTDAVQALTKVPIDVKDQNIDLLSLSAHKIYGPKGIGALYVKKGVKLQTIQHGGGHESGLRSSTYNTPGIIGLAKACELGIQRMDKDVAYMKSLRDTLIKNLLEIEECHLNGHQEQRLANNVHVRFTAIEGEALNLMLDDKGIAAATGSACSSKKLKASHVLLGIGLTPEQAHGSLRLTLGRMSSKEDIKYVSEVVPGVVKGLRNMSPLWNR